MSKQFGKKHNTSGIWWLARAIPLSMLQCVLIPCIFAADSCKVSFEVGLPAEGHEKVPIALNYAVSSSIETDAAAVAKPNGPDTDDPDHRVLTFAKVEAWLVLKHYDSAHTELVNLYDGGQRDSRVTCLMAETLHLMAFYPLHNSTLFFCARCVESDRNYCSQVQPYVTTVGAGVLTCHDIDSAAVSLRTLSDSCPQDGCTALLAEAADLLRYIDGANENIDVGIAKSKLKELCNTISKCEKDDLRAEVLATTAVRLVESEYKRGVDLALKVLESAIEKGIVEDTVCRTYAWACFHKTRNATTASKIFDEANEGLKLVENCGGCGTESCEAVLCREALSAGRRLVQAGSPELARDWADSMAFKVSVCCEEASDLFGEAVMSFSAAQTITDFPSEQLIADLNTRGQRIADKCGKPAPNIDSLLAPEFVNKHALTLARQADSLWHFGSSDSAFKLLQRAENFAPNMDTILLKLGIALIETNQCDVSKLEAATRNAKDETMLKRAQGFLAYASQDYSKAVEEFTGAIELSQSDYESWYGCGLAHLEMAHVELSKLDCNTALTYHDQSVSDLEEASRSFARHSPWSNGGDQVHESPRFTRSIDTSKALKNRYIVRCDRYATVNLYKDVINSGDKEAILLTVLPALLKCLESFQSLIRIRIDSVLNADILFNIGLSYERLVEYENAKDYYRKTIGYDSSWYAGYRGMGSVHFEEHDYRLCIEYLEKSEERGGKSDWLYEKLAKAYCEQENRAMSQMNLFRILNPDRQRLVRDELEEGCED